MPYRPASPCRQPGCPALVPVGTGGYCQTHKRERTRGTDARRGSREQRGYDWRWRKYQAWYLRGHPICVAPGCGRPATDVDHIVRHNGQSDPLFWDEANHQALCKSCHSRKTGLEQRRYGAPGGGS